MAQAATGRRELGRQMPGKYQTMTELVRGSKLLWVCEKCMGLKCEWRVDDEPRQQRLHAAPL